MIYGREISGSINMKSAIGTLRRTSTSSSLITSDKSATAGFGHGVFFQKPAAEQYTRWFAEWAANARPRPSR